MISAVEQTIVDRADGRLLANRREFRWVRKDGIFCIGWLARLVNLGLVQTLERRLTPEMVATMAADVTPLHHSEQIGAFAGLTLAAPCLAYARPDGHGVLIDGLKRAKQAFALGRSDVPVKIIKLDDAKRLGMSVEHRALWKALEATEHHPIGARQKRNFDRAIVELRDDREAPRRGQPAFSEQQNVLANSAIYFLTVLIDLEFFIYKNFRDVALAKCEPKLKKPIWADTFLFALYQSGRIPVAQSASEVANRAGTAIAFMIGAGGRAEFKRRGQADWVQMSSEVLVAERDLTLELCAAVMKADLRLRLRQTFSRALVNRENNPPPEVHWRYVRSMVEGSDDQSEKEFEASRLRFDEQLMVTHATGVNMNDVYHDHTNRDPLFQAYAFAFGVERDRKAFADPCMVETVVHRRAMSILGQTDALTDCWDGLFEHWRHRGLDDIALLDMVQQLDAAQSFYDGIKVLLR